MKRLEGFWNHSAATRYTLSTDEVSCAWSEPLAAFCAPLMYALNCFFCTRRPRTLSSRNASFALLDFLERLAIRHLRRRDVSVRRVFAEGLSESIDFKAPELIIKLVGVFFKDRHIRSADKLVRRVYRLRKVCEKLFAKLNLRWLNASPRNLRSFFSDQCFVLRRTAIRLARFTRRERRRRFRVSRC